MRRKAVGFTMVMILMAGMVLSACSSNDAGKSEATDNPSSPAKMSGDDSKANDDMSKKVTINFVENGWINTPTDDNDPWKKWINETYNVDFHLLAYPAKDIGNKLLVQFSSNDPPDMIYVSDINTVRKLYQQGVLLEDWTPYLKQVPTLAKTLDVQRKALVNENGKIIGLPSIPDTNLWTFKIRKDWLANLGLQMPKTDQELLDVLRKFTYNDPDKNGKDDTWGITSAGSGANLGRIQNLEYMFGPSGFFINGNKADNSIVNGTHKKFLDFMRTVVKEKLIDPDWYTQSWIQHKPKIFNGQIGVVMYPGVLVNEMEAGTGSTGKTLDWYEDMPMPKGDDAGGKLPPALLNNGIIAISAKAAKDPVKLNRILHIIEASTYPNDGFWALRWGVGVNGQKITDIEGIPGGGKFIDVQNDPYRKDHRGAWDWGTWIGTSSDNVLQSSNSQLGKSDMVQIQMDNEAMKMPAFPNDQAVLNLDPQISSDLQTMQNQFDAKYVIGEETDYEAFKQKWLKSGGQQLLDEATKQFKSLGMIH